MAINTLPNVQPPAGAGNLIFGGISSNGFYTYTGSLPAGKYIVQIYPAPSASPTTIANSVSSANAYAVTTKSNGSFIQSSTSTAVVTGAQTFYINLFTTETSFSISSNWTRFTGLTTTADYLAYPIYTNNTLYAVNTATTGTLWTSTNNGFTWSSFGSTYGGSGTVQDLIINTTTTYKYIVGFSGPNFRISTDATTWTSVSASGTGASSGVINPPATQKYILVGWGTNQIYVKYSTDGVTWNGATVPSLTGSQAFTNCIATNGTASTNQIYVIGTNTQYVLTSTDGITWSSRTLGFAATGSVAYGNGYYVTTDQGGGPVRIGYSTDGVTWTTVNLPNLVGASQAIQNINFVNGMFFTRLATQGCVTFLTSTNATTWNTYVMAGEPSISSRPAWTGSLYFHHYTGYSTNGGAGMISQPAYYAVYQAASGTLN